MNEETFRNTIDKVVGRPGEYVVTVDLDRKEPFAPLFQAHFGSFPVLFIQYTARPNTPGEEWAVVDPWYIGAGSSLEEAFCLFEEDSKKWFGGIPKTRNPDPAP